MSATQSPIAVTIAVLTYRRPATLATCLAGLVPQAEALGKDGAWDTRILVVDNDPEASAHDAVTRLAARHPLLTYRVEPTPGIAAARQRCLDESTDSRLLVFIDDDEEPSPTWLAALVDTWRTHGRPAGVAGSIRARFSVPPPAFVTAGGFFDRAQYPTGTALHAAPTSNLLLDLDQVHDLGLAFDQRLGTHGGEDTLLTGQITARGGRIVFARDAVVSDLVPPTRANRRWVLARARHMGITHSLVTLMDSPTPLTRTRARAALVAGGLARAGTGAARAGYGWARGSVSAHARGLRVMNRGWGMVRGVLPGVNPQYARGS